MLNILFKCLVYFTHLCNLHWFFLLQFQQQVLLTQFLSIFQKKLARGSVSSTWYCLIFVMVSWIWIPERYHHKAQRTPFQQFAPWSTRNLHGPHQSLLKHLPFSSRLSPPKSTLSLFKLATPSGGTTWFWPLLWNLSVYKACLGMVWLMLLFWFFFPCRLPVFSPKIKGCRKLFFAIIVSRISSCYQCRMNCN